MRFSGGRIGRTRTQVFENLPGQVTKPMASAVKDVRQPVDAQSEKDAAYVPVRSFSDMGNFPHSGKNQTGETLRESVDATSGLAKGCPSAVLGKGGVGGKGSAAAKRGNYNSEEVDDDVPIVLPTVEEARAKVADAFARNARVGENPFFGRTRSTPLGEIEWDRVDPLALSKADRRQADDLKYSRPHISAAQMDVIKQKWQARQVKRVSNAARLYGARESQKELWEFLAVHEKEKQQREERHHSSQAEASEPSSAASGARSQGVRSAQAGNWGNKDQDGKSHASHEGGVDFSAADAAGAHHVAGIASSDSRCDTIKHVAPLPKTSSKTTLKSISKAFKNMMGSQKPGKMENLIQRMSKTHVPTSYMDTV